MKKNGSSAIHGEVTIIYKNLRTLQAANDQAVERIDCAAKKILPTKEGLQMIWNSHYYINEQL